MVGREARSAQPRVRTLSPSLCGVLWGELFFVFLLRCTVSPEVGG